MRPLRTLARAAALSLVVAAAGCGGPARFVSPDPPPNTAADAWFRSGVPAVRAALAAAMERNGIAIDREACTPTVVAGVRHQLPYVDGSSGEPVRGALPAYRLRAVLTRAERTHVRLTLRPQCASCDGRTLYEWEYPGDVIRTVFEDTRRILGERGHRFSYPPRYRPARWPRP